MERIILTRQKLKEDSLILQTITPEGVIEKYKIPGILKSKKRNSFFMTPATLWDFTVAGNPREIMTPKEYTLLLAPFSTDVTWEELSRLAELIKPLLVMGVAAHAPENFALLKETLLQWPEQPDTERERLLDRYYVRFLDHLGLLHWSQNCIECGITLAPDSVYLLSAGSLCPRCAGQTLSNPNDRLPQSWIESNLHGEETAAGISGLAQRERILAFFKTMT